MGRYAILEVSLDFILDACKKNDDRPFFTTTLTANPIPDDARIVHVSYPLRYDDPRVVKVMLESSAFADVPAFAKLPTLPAPSFARKEWTLDDLYDAATEWTLADLDNDIQKA